MAMCIWEKEKKKKEKDKFILKIGFHTMFEADKSEILGVEQQLRNVADC